MIEVKNITDSDSLFAASQDLPLLTIPEKQNKPLAAQKRAKTLPGLVVSERKAL
ncbi:hypothetical protein HQN64_06965 [Enterobacteriaceae bacterium BIT-l23]|uniref:hypothetical protein n=1 Tax=Jejubacter sp. L23 TaxID=3092086 RepID=UPI0015848F29|nr:hypothetical protein [Enterobacteriaceae bacterium BIT-l23]